MAPFTAEILVRAVSRTVSALSDVAMPRLQRRPEMVRSTRTFKVTLRLSPGAMSAPVQVRVPALSVAPLAALASAKPLGRMSLRTTFLAVVLPTFLTVMR